VIFFLKGLAFGFLLAATVGPMWVLCFRRTLEQGALAGLVSGMGIAVADGIYGSVAAFGLAAVSGFLLQHAFWIGLVGGLFLVYLGVKALVARPPGHAAEPLPASLAQGFLSTLGLTLANPPTILVVLGVFLGSAAWWLVLAAATGWLRRRIGPRVLRAVNVVSGLVILGFAAWQLATILR
jgi:threonine/homoserine/homoserine lactone efflux protein